MLEQLLTDLQNGNTKALARSISLVENEQPGYEALLLSLPANETARVMKNHNHLAPPTPLYCIPPGCGHGVQ